jgi:hypothetical protein
MSSNYLIVMDFLLETSYLEETELNYKTLLLILHL